MISRVNKQDIGSGSASFTFDGGACNCAILKLATNGLGATAVDYGGTAMVKFGEISDTAGWTHQMWGAQNAPNGSVTVTITIGGGVLITSVESYADVHPTATFPNVANQDEHHNGAGDLTNIQVDVVTTENNCALVGLGGYRGIGITFMSAGDSTSKISSNPSSGGEDVSFESTSLSTGIAGTYHLQGTTGGGSSTIVISLIVAALTPIDFIPQVIII